MTNPLLKYARRAEMSILLPSSTGEWYEEGMIDYTPNGEVEVYPMLPKDELMLLNPDSLLSGQVNIDMIKSCVPSIKCPEKLLYPDANVLFLAIQKATYGNTLTMSAICPKCQEKAIQIQDKEKIEEAEKRGEIIIHDQDMEYDIGSILSSITYLKSEYTVKTDEGLIIYLRPNILKDKMKYGLMSYNQQKILKAYKDYDYEKRSTNDEAQSEIIENVTECYNKMNEIGNQLITSCISKIKLPDDTFVSDSQMIYEYVSNTKTSLIMKLHQKIKEMNDVGLPTTLSYRCSCCGHEWEDKFYGYNQVDFFGIGS